MKNSSVDENKFKPVLNRFSNDGAHEETLNGKRNKNEI